MHKHLNSSTFLTALVIATHATKFPLAYQMENKNYDLARNFNEHLETGLASVGLVLGQDILFEKKDDTLVIVLTNDNAMVKAITFVETTNVPPIVSKMFEQRRDGMFAAPVSIDEMRQVLRTGIAKAKQQSPERIVIGKIQSSTWVSRLLSLSADSATARKQFVGERSASGANLKTA